MSLLPPSATQQEAALEQVTSRIGAVPVPIPTMWSPQTCPAAILPWLGWALAVDGWDQDWTEAQKRGAIASAIDIHRHKGTIGAVRRALQAIGYEVQVEERPGGVPYTFRLLVRIVNSAPPYSIYDKAAALANRAKNARSHLTAVLPYMESGVTMYGAGATVSGVATTIGAFDTPSGGGGGGGGTGGGGSTGDTTGTAILFEDGSRVLGEDGSILTYG